MAADMSQTALVSDLKAILMSASSKFTAALDADFIRHLDLAALDMGRVKPRTRLGSITLVADQIEYAAPTDLVRPKVGLWGMQERKTRKPWDSNWPEVLPIISMVDGASGMEIHLNPPPTAAQITDLGSEYKFYYFAGHVIDTDAALTTVQAGHWHILMIRATAQALQELANNGITKPVQLGNAGVGSMPKNGTPAALAEQLMKQFEAMAA